MLALCCRILLSMADFQNWLIEVYKWKSIRIRCSWNNEILFDLPLPCSSILAKTFLAVETHARQAAATKKAREECRWWLKSSKQLYLLFAYRLQWVLLAFCEGFYGAPRICLRFVLKLHTLKKRHSDSMIFLLALFHVSWNNSFCLTWYQNLCYHRFFQ